MKNLKHVGKLKNTGAKVLVVFRTLPGESNSCLVLPTATLPDQYHDALISLVDSDQGQSTNEFGEIMFMRRFPDGRPMLQAMQADNRLQKVSTTSVIMTPTASNEIPLDQLNVLIAEQKGVSVGDLAALVNGSHTAKPEQVEAQTETTEPVATPTPVASNEPLTDVDLARSYRSQADSLYKEAARLRKQADELDPPKKKSAKKEDQVTESA